MGLSVIAVRLKYTNYDFFVFITNFYFMKYKLKREIDSGTVFDKKIISLK